MNESEDLEERTLLAKYEYYAKNQPPCREDHMKNRTHKGLQVEFIIQDTISVLDLLRRKDDEIVSCKYECYQRKEGHCD